jgi:signal transduction histidine kinase
LLERGRRSTLALGFALGVAAALLAASTRQHWVAWVALPVLGGAIAHLIEVRRAGARNLKLAQELNDVLRTRSDEAVEARAEIVAHQRQRAALERIVEDIDGLQQARASTVRRLSHDIRNSLFVVRGNTQFLRERLGDGDEGEALLDMENAALHIGAAVSKLVEVATADEPESRRRAREIRARLPRPASDQG